MKKALYAAAVASTALVGAAYAEDGVKLSGYGRFGLSYYDVDGFDGNTTMYAGRLRFNIDASKTTDSGVTFGGRIRLQWDQGDTIGDSSGESGAELSPAMMYVSYGGLRVEVGNATTAFDAAALLYASEIGFQDRSFGDPIGDFFAFSSNPRGNAYRQYVGIYAAYSVGDFTGRISYVKPDQTDLILPDDENEAEIGISGNYTFGDFIVSAAAVQNGAGIDGNDMWFIGGAWSANGLTVGLNYQDGGDVGDVDQGSIVTLYGSKTFGAFEVAGYVAQREEGDLDIENDTVYGLGGSYDLGGARLSAAIESGFAEGETRADIGVRFDF